MKIKNVVHNKRVQWLTFSIRDLIITVIFMILAIALSAALRLLADSEQYVPMIFVLAVFLISRYTTGYLFGSISSLAGVILANYIFTYPYFEVNFTISGYPITFICMLLTSIMTGTLTTQIKHQDKIRMEAEKEKMRANLLRAVSHDLRTPLTSIVGITAALLDNEGKISIEKQRELLGEAHDDAQWLIRMVENLLSITRMNCGEAKINKSPEAVEEIIGEAVRKFKKQFPEANVSVSVPDELLMVPMDAILIEQVMINLLGNAQLHGQTTTKIQINLIRMREEAIITVSDNGTGISTEAFNHLFDGYMPGTLTDESDSKRNMGIGLSVCMSIVKAHGGDMTAWNKPDGGAVFKFTLPLDKEDNNIEAEGLNC